MTHRASTPPAGLRPVPAPPIQRLVRRFGALRPQVMRGAWWGWRAAGSARAQLQAGIAEDCRLAPATATGPGADRGVRIALRLRRATCLESALVRRAAVAAHGTARDLVIGVARDGGGYVAHAWLEGDGVDPRYTELTRWPVR